MAYLQLQKLIEIDADFCVILSSMRVACVGESNVRDQWFQISSDLYKIGDRLKELEYSTPRGTIDFVMFRVPMGNCVQGMIIQISGLCDDEISQLARKNCKQKLCIECNSFAQLLNDMRQKCEAQIANERRVLLQRVLELLG